MTRAAKRSRTARRPPPSKSLIDELPDILLVEILCRLPHNKVVYQCKLVSKRLCTLLSDPYFVGRFLRLQHDQQKPLVYAYAMIPDNRTFQTRDNFTVLTMSLEPPYSVVDKPISIYSLLPCFQDRFYAHKGEKLVVAGAYNDLVLCSPTERFQCDYYICNSYTKEWVRLPPTPRVDEFFVPVGFICDPYYSTKEDGNSSNSSIIKLNAEYRCKVVRLLRNNNYGFYVEIYSSETGEWREYQLSKVLRSQKNKISFDFVRRCTGVACNGKLYWWNFRGFMFELDPFNIRSTDNNIIDTCSFIDAPYVNIDFPDYKYIGVCQGRLRMCPYWLRDSDDPVTIWELKENQVNGKPEWRLICDRVSLSQMVHKPPLVYDPRLILQVVGFHPRDGDILYLQFPKCTVKCNVREKTLERATENPFFEIELCGYKTRYYTHRESYPSVFPWWPTPVQKRLHYCDDYNVTVTGEESEIHIVEDYCGKPARRKRKRKTIAQCRS
ncbi:hypothetical protein ACLB2K_064749 [Fragaria x ananassa]